MRKTAQLFAAAVAVAGLVACFWAPLRADDGGQPATQPDFKGSPAAQEATAVYRGEVTKADADYQAAVAALQAKHDQRIDAARKEYIAALKKEQVEQTKKGNLDLAVQIRDFVAMLESGRQPVKEPNQTERADLVARLDGTTWRFSPNGIEFTYSGNGTIRRANGGIDSGHWKKVSETSILVVEPPSGAGPNNPITITFTDDFRHALWVYKNGDVAWALNISH